MFKKTILFMTCFFFEAKAVIVGVLTPATREAHLREKQAKEALQRQAAEDLQKKLEQREMLTRENERLRQAGEERQRQQEALTRENERLRQAGEERQRQAAEEQAQALKEEEEVMKIPPQMIKISKERLEGGRQCLKK